MERTRRLRRSLPSLIVIAMVAVLTLFTGCRSYSSSNLGTGAASTYNGIGTVVTVNPQRPSIEISHEEIKGYMPAMQMEFPVKDRTLLNSIKPGDKVDFTLEVNQGIEQVTTIHKR